MTRTSHALAQTVSHWLGTVEMQVLCLDRQCAPSGCETDFSPSVLQQMIIIIPPVFYIRSSSGFGTISCPLAATLQRDSQGAGLGRGKRI
jgi:hypothetical protein